MKNNPRISLLWGLDIAPAMRSAFHHWHHSQWLLYGIKIGQYFIGITYRKLNDS